MIFRQLNSAGDWTFGKGQADYAQAEAAIELNIRTRLLSWVGDCFFALLDGVDWYGLLDVGQQQNLVEALQSNIMNAFGVVGINSVDAVFDGQTRKMNIQYSIETIYSPAFQGSIQAAGGTVS